MVGLARASSLILVTHPAARGDPPFNPQVPPICKTHEYDAVRCVCPYTPSYLTSTHSSIVAKARTLVRWQSPSGPIMHATVRSMFRCIYTARCQKLMHNVGSSAPSLGSAQLHNNWCLCNTVYYSLLYVCGLCTSVSLLQQSYGTSALCSNCTS